MLQLGNSQPPSTASPTALAASAARYRARLADQLEACGRAYGMASSAHCAPVLLLLLVLVLLVLLLLVLLLV